MTKTSGRKVNCATCNEPYNDGKHNNRPCPVCTGIKAPTRKVKRNKYGR